MYHCLITMNFALKNITLKCFVFFMALQILNQSIDAIDFQPICAANSIADFNDINSATEYISEIVLGNKDAFPEYQTQSSSHHKAAQSFKHVNIKLFQPQPHCYIPNQFIDIVTFAYPLDERYSFLFSKDITPPPPKV